MVPKWIVGVSRVILGGLRGLLVDFEGSLGSYGEFLRSLVAPVWILGVSGWIWGGLWCLRVDSGCLSGGLWGNSGRL